MNELIKIFIRDFVENTETDWEHHIEEVGRNCLTSNLERELNVFIEENNLNLEEKLKEKIKDKIRTKLENKGFKVEKSHWGLKIEKVS